jgi:rubrerythrin
MRLRTASQAFSLAKDLEEESAVFYEQLAVWFPEHAEAFGGFAAGNRRFRQQVERAYYGVITDAIEGGFAFDMETDDFALDTSQPAGLDEALQRAKEMEAKVIRFYTEAADQSRTLMADLPRAFDQVVKRRNRTRLPALDELSG